MQPEISVVIPAYREEKGIGVALAEVSKYLNQATSEWEIVVVDDGSNDGTWSALEKAAASMPQLHALRLSRNFGKEAALAAGLEAARGRAVVFMDGDLQHPPHLLPSMIDAWRSGQCDVVEAVKSRRDGESPLAATRARLFYWMFKAFTGYDLNGASDFKLLDRKVIDAYATLQERNLFFRGMVSWLGFRTTQIPFDVEPRFAGQTGWSVLGLLRLATVAITSFSSFPLHLITIFGGIFLLFSLLLGAQTLYMKFSGQAVDGFTTVILLLLIIGSFLMIGLGIIGEYLARIYNEVKGRPRYLVADRIGTSSTQRPDTRDCEDAAFHS